PDDPLALCNPLAGAQGKRHARQAPIVDEAFEGDEGLGIGLRIDAFLLFVADELPAHDVARLDWREGAEHLVLFLADRPGRERCRRLHRHEPQDLEQVGDDHVAIGAGLLVEAGALAEVEGLRHVDLDVVDEIAAPDRLEQAVGEPEGEDILRRLLAEEMIDAENWFLAKNFWSAVLRAARVWGSGA